MCLHSSFMISHSLTVIDLFWKFTPSNFLEVSLQIISFRHHIIFGHLVVLHHGVDSRSRWLTHFPINEKSASPNNDEDNCNHEDKREECGVSLPIARIGWCPNEFVCSASCRESREKQKNFNLNQQAANNKERCLIDYLLQQSSGHCNQWRMRSMNHPMNTLALSIDLKRKSGKRSQALSKSENWERVTDRRKHWIVAKLDRIRFVFALNRAGIMCQSIRERQERERDRDRDRDRERTKRRKSVFKVTILLFFCIQASSGGCIKRIHSHWDRANWVIGNEGRTGRTEDALETIEITRQSLIEIHLHRCPKRERIRWQRESSYQVRLL